uniref:alpha-N-acetylgalactosaminide alpha-2,6-sialyltransferase n=1 Tax=Neogobius melanostomus TaxID=47308 RepID=A0A8C6UFR9_9GOBI
MAVRLLQSPLLPGLFTLVIGTLLYVSWTDIMGTFSADDSNDFPPTTTDPPGLTPIPVLVWKDYKKLPRWDFDDQYRRDRQPSKTTQECRSSLWNVIKQDPELRDKFIPDVRMFVHNGSISMSEWNRLSHFNNPFGFMNYSHDDVMPALNLIPKPKNPLLLPKPGRDCISCAVVGAGGVLWKSRKGREIDNHDYVFRVNGAAIKSFEEDVGNRTDVYVHTSHSITSSALALKKYNYTGAPHDEGIKYVLIPEGMRDYRWMTGLYKRERLSNDRRPWTYYSGQFNETRFYVLHMDFLRYTRNRFLNTPNLNGTWWNIVRPSNGAFAMFLALHLCDSVNAYGFITDSHKKYSNYYYERGADTHVIFYANHDLGMERDLWKTLHELKVINLYQGEP